MDAAKEKLKPEYVMVHKITRWTDSGKIIEEHCEDDDAENVLWDVWVRAGEHGQPEELEQYAGQFTTRESALIYATTLASILDVEIDEY